MLICVPEVLRKSSRSPAGERFGSFSCCQSMAREDQNPSLLFDLDQTIQELSTEQGAEHPSVVRLTGIYHNPIHACWLAVHAARLKLPEQRSNSACPSSIA